jgi:CPA1 family monovalent cation:H+ antiporter
MHILEISTVLLVIASAFSLVNLRILKLPLTIGLMVQGLIMSFVILGIGTVYPPFLDKATALTQTFDFSELLVNVMLPFLLFA